MQVVAHAHEVLRGKPLLAVRAPAQEHQVDARQVHVLAVVHAAHLHGDAALARPALEHFDVPAVAVQVEQVGEEVRDHERGGVVLSRLGASRPGKTPGRLRGERRPGRLPPVRKPSQLGMHGRERGVVRYHVGARIGRQTAQLREHAGCVVNQRGIQTGVLQAHLHVVLADAAREHAEAGLAGQLLEVDVPQPRHVATVALLVVHEEGHRLRPLVLQDDLDVLVEPGGVLGQVQQRAAARHRELLQAAVARVERVDGTLQRLGRHAHEVGRGPGCQQVVHHVRAAERRLDLGIAPRPVRGERQPVGAQVHVPGGTVQRGAREPASGAAVRTQLPVLAVRVFQHGGATLAHLRVGYRVLRQVQVLVHAEGDRGVAHALGDGGAQRVVGIEHERGLRRRCERTRNALLDAVDLAHPVQLVAEQVQQHHVVRLQVRQDLRQPQLVAFEHAPVGLAGVQQRRGHAGVQVRARAVAHHALTGGFQRVGQEVRHRGLAVRAHHAH